MNEMYLDKSDMTLCVEGEEYCESCNNTDHRVIDWTVVPKDVFDFLARHGIKVVG